MILDGRPAELIAIHQMAGATAVGMPTLTPEICSTIRKQVS